ncbi:MAG: hypothetical protein RJQ14_05850 [Marinoscillum sp.]
MIQLTKNLICFLFLLICFQGYGQSYRAELTDLLSASPFVMELNRMKAEIGVDLVGTSRLFETNREIVFTTSESETYRAHGNYDVEFNSLLIYSEDKTYVMEIRYLQSFTVRDSLGHIDGQYINPRLTLSGNHTDEILEVLYQDSVHRFSWLKRYMVSFSDEVINDQLGVGRFYQKYLRANQYLFFDGSSLLPVNSWKGLLMNTGKSRSLVKQFIKVNQLTFSNEKHQHHVLTYYTAHYNNKVSMDDIIAKRKLLKFRIGGQAQFYNQSYSYEAQEDIYFSDQVKVQNDKFNYFYDGAEENRNDQMFLECSIYPLEWLSFNFQYSPFKYQISNTQYDTVYVPPYLPETHPWHRPDSTFTGESSIAKTVRFNYFTPSMTFEKRFYKGFGAALTMGWSFVQAKEMEDVQTNNFSSLSGGIELSWRDYVFLRYQVLPFTESVIVEKTQDQHVTTNRSFKMSNVQSLVFGVSIPIQIKYTQIKRVVY